MSVGIGCNSKARFPSASFCTSARCASAILALFAILVHSSLLTGQESRPIDLKRITELYVPAPDLESVWPRDKRGVVLPRTEFDVLLQKARQSSLEAPDASNRLLVTSADYAGRIIGGQLVIVATIKLVQPADGARVLRLAYRGVAIESAKLDGSPARLARVPGEDPAIEVFNDRKGPHTLELELAVPIIASGPDRLAAFGLGRLPVGTLTLGAAANERLYVDEMLVQPVAPIAKESVYAIPLGGKDEVRLRLSDRALEQASDRLVLARTDYHLTATLDDAAWEATTSLDVYGQAVDRLTIAAPAGLKIADIDSTGLESWTVDEKSGTAPTAVTLVYRRPFKETRNIRFRGILRAAEGKLPKVSALRIAGVSAHVGHLCVDYPSDLRVRIEGTSGLRPVESDGGARSAATASLCFEAWSEDFSFTLAAERKGREIVARALTSLAISDSGLELKLAARLESLYSPLFDAEVWLPAEWTIVEVAGERGVTWQTSSIEAGTHHLTVSFPAPIRPGRSAAVNVVARRSISPWPIDEAGVEVPLPELRLPNAGVLEGTYTIGAPDDLDLAPIDVTGLDPARLNLPGERIGYRYQDTRFSGKLKIARRPARLSAEMLIVSRLDPSALRTNLNMTIEALGGGFRRLDILLPESAGSAIRFRTDRTDAPVVEQKVGDPVHGERQWTLTFGRYVKGTIGLRAVVETPRGNATEFRVPEARLVDVTRQSGYLVLQTAADRQLTANPLGPDGEPLAEVDLADLPPLPVAPDARVVAAYRIAQPGNRVTLAEAKFDHVPMSPAVCKACRIETISGRTGDGHHLATFSLIAGGVQSLRLAMPEQAVIWGMLLDNRPIEVRTVDNAYWVPLPPAATPNAERTLAVFYATPQLSDEHNAAPAGPWTRQLRQRQTAPALSVVGRSSTPEPVEMLDQQWRLYYPPDAIVTQSEGAFEPVLPLSSASPLGLIAREIESGSIQAIGWKLLFAVATIGVTALLAVGFVRARVAGLTIAIGGTLALGLAVYFIISFQAPESLSARYASRTLPAATAAKSAAPEQFPAISNFSDQESAPKQQVGQPALPIGMGRFGSTIVTQNNAPRVGGAPKAIAPDRAPAQERSTPAMLGKGFTGGGRLSIPIDFDIPPHDRWREFHFSGRNATLDAPPRLDVQIESLARIRTSCTAIAAVVAYFLWSLRRARPRWRTLLCILGLTLPLALIAIVPLPSQFWLDGIFFGTLGGVGLWLGHAAAGCLFAGEAAGRRGFGRTKAAVVSAVLAAWAADASAVVAGEAGVQSGATPGAGANRVIIPYDPGRNPLSADRVLLEQRMFLELWNLANPERPIGERPKQESAVCGAVYSAKIVGDDASAAPKTVYAAVSGRLILASFVDRPTNVTLPFQQVAIKRAAFDGRPTGLIARRNAREKSDPALRFDAVVPTRGVHTLEVEFDVPVRMSGPAGELTIPLLPVASGRLSLDVPRRSLHFRVSGPDAGFRQREDSSRTFIDVPIAAAGELTIGWRPDQEASASDRTFAVQGATAVAVEDGGLRVESHFRMHIAHGGVGEFIFSLPPNLKIQDIRGPDVGGWKISGEDPARRLIVTLRRNISGDTLLHLRCYRAFDPGAKGTILEIPLVAPASAARDTGTVAIFSGTQFEIRRPAETDSAAKSRSANIVQIDSREFPAAEFAGLAQRTPEFAFRYAARPQPVHCLASRRQTEIDVTPLHGVIVGRRKVDVSTRLRMSVSGPGVTRVEIAVPRDFLVLSVLGPRIADWQNRQMPGGSKALAIEFAGPQRGQFELIVNGTVSRNPEDLKAIVHVPVLTSARRSQAELAIWLDESYGGTPEASNDWRAQTLDQVQPELKSLLRRLPRFSFRTNQARPAPLTVNLTRATPQLAADSATVLTATDTSVFYTLALKWTISHAPADEFSFTTPDWLAGKLDFVEPQPANPSHPRLRQVVSVKLPDQRVRWTLSLQEPAGDQFALAATAMFPLSADHRIAMPAIAFEAADGTGEERRWQPLATQRHYVMMTNQSTARLSEMGAESIEPVGPDEIPFPLDAQLVKQALQVGRLIRPQSAPVWQIERPPVEKGAPAVVNLAELLTVVERDGSWRARGIYRIKNRTRQFLAVAIPPGSEILSVIAQSKPSRTVARGRTEKTVFLVPLPAVSEADLSIEVQIIIGGTLSSPLPRYASLLAKNVAIPAPQVLSPEADREYGIPVARTKWTVYLPQEQIVRAVDDPKQTNLDQSNEDEASLFERSALLDEARQLMSVLASTPSDRTNYRALENLESLEQKLKSESDYSKSGEFFARPPANSEFRQRAESVVLGEIAAAQSHFRIDKSRQIATTHTGAAAKNFTPEDQSRQARNLVARERGRPISQPENAAAMAAGARGGKKGVPFGFRADEAVAGTKESSDPRARLRTADDNDSVALADQMKDLHAGPASKPTAIRPQQTDGDEDRKQRDAAKADQLDFDYRPATGSLSLKFEIRQIGQKLVFTKVGGDPRLTVALRSRKTLDRAFDVVWLIVWTALGGALAVTFGISGRTFAGRRLLPCIVIAVGLVWFLLLPFPVSYVGLAAMAAGTALETRRRLRTA